MGSGLTSRNRVTLAAAARVLIPSGGPIPWGADDLGLAERIAAEVEGWPRGVRRRLRVALTVFELLPMTSGRRPFSRLDRASQERFFAETYRHRAAWRRLLASLLKQLAYAAYLSVPEVEQAVGYRYECARPRGGVAAEPKEQVHH